MKLHLRKPTFLLTNPDDIRHVLITHLSRYAKTPRLSSKRAQRALGKGILTLSSGPEHRRQRRMLQPLFHPKSVPAFGDIIVQTTEETLTGWRTGSILDMAGEMNTLAQRIMLRTLFGSDWMENGDALEKAIRMRRRYYEHNLGSLFPFPDYLPVRVVRDYPKAMKIILNAVQSAIQGRRNRSLSDDMISAFVSSTYEDGTRMSDHQIRDEALTFIDAGYETTAAALAWTWYLLAQHSQIQSQLLRELQEELKGRPPLAQDLPRLQYAGKVLAESLRLYPPTWMFVRVALQKDTLPGGATITPGAKLYLCQYLAHRRADYFRNPERFDPERMEWTETNRSRFAYFPFGGGPHSCIGETFARTEILMVLAMVAQRFQCELIPGQNIVPDPGVALRPKNGIRMRVSLKTGGAAHT